MPRFLTRIELHFGRDLFNYYIRFGEAKRREELDRRRALEFFTPGQLFGYVRWQANEYGTQDWRFWVLCAGDLHRPLCRVPGVTPGADILLALAGKDCVHKAFEAVDAIEALNIDPADVSPSYYRHVQQRILTRLPVRAYSMDQHRALSLQKAVCG